MFQSIFERYSWEEIAEAIYSTEEHDVERVLQRGAAISPEDFAVLVSPAASHYLETLANLSRRRTEQRFGKTIQLFAPLYLSNLCHNVCTYCGFSVSNRLPRKVLTIEEITQELAVLTSHGFQHVLFVAGEARTVGAEYYAEILSHVRNALSHISLEVQPLESSEYVRLENAGLDAVLVYQETYRKDRYRQYHPRGKKSQFWYRLDTPDRLGAAGIRKIGIGALLGLEDWRVDSWFTALHLHYLRNRYWKTQYSISFPRLRPAEGLTNMNMAISDRELVQLICAFRLFDADTDLSMSTREAETLRDNCVGLGITSMSAGSKTDPGGYSTTERNLEQFQIADRRTPLEVARMIGARGYEAVWKNWDRGLSTHDRTNPSLSSAAVFA